MRREQHIEAKIAVAVEAAFDDQHVPARVGGDAQPERVALMLVEDFDRRHARRDEPQRVILVALDLGPEAARPGHDKAEIADLRGIDARVIDFVDDAEAEREPKPRRPQRGADDILGAAGPAGRDPGHARSVSEGAFGLCFGHGARIVARPRRITREPPLLQKERRLAPPLSST